MVLKLKTLNTQNLFLACAHSKLINSEITNLIESRQDSLGG
jgi:hypothetical protein